MESPPTGRPTSPEAETAPGAAGGLLTAAAMPKGPKQQPPEPEWIGDGEGTSPAGEWGRRQEWRGRRRPPWSVGPAHVRRGRGRVPRAVLEPREADGRREDHMSPREGRQDRN